MSNSINVRFLVYCLLALLVAAGGLHLAYSVQYERNSATLLALAGEAEAAGDTARTLRFLGQYVLRVPSDAEARARLGFILESQARSPEDRWQARGVFEQVLIRDPRRGDVRRRLALLAVEQRDFDLAQPHLEMLLESQPDDAQLQLSLGLCLESRRKYAEAEGHYHKAHEADAGQIQAYARHAFLLRDHLNQPAKAKTIIEQMIQANGKSFEAYLAKAAYYQNEDFVDTAQKKEGLKLAAQAIDRALALAPDNPVVLLAVARLAQESGDGIDKARGHLLRLVESFPKAVDAYQLLVGLEVNSGHPEEAIRWLRRGLKQLPDHPNLLWNLTHLLLDSEKLEEAKTVLGLLRKQKLPPGRLELLQAVLQVREGHWTEAGQTLESIRSFFKDQKDLAYLADRYLARCYENRGDLEHSLRTLRRMLAGNPFDHRSRLALANTLLKIGRLDESVIEFQNLLESSQAPAENWVKLAGLLLNQSLRAGSTAQQWDNLAQVLGKAEKSNPGSPEVTILRAQYHLARKEPKEARAVLQNACSEQPRQLRLRLALAGLEEREGRTVVAQTMLRDIEKELGDSAALRLARLPSALGKGGAKAVEALDGLRKGIDHFSVEEQGTLLGALGDAAYRLKDLDRAQRWWAEWAELDPRNLDVRVQLFELALERNQEAAARMVLEAIQKIEGQSRPLGLYAQARLCIWQASKGEKARLQEASSLLSLVESRRPSWSQVALARAEISELENNPQEAVRNYLKAVEQGSRQLGPIRRLIQLLYEQQRYDEAEMVLQKLPEETVLSGNLMQIAAEVSLQTRDYKRALVIATRSINPDSKDYRDHLWLGQILSAASASGTDRSAQAEKALRKAIQLGEDKPETWVALIQFLARRQRLKDAQTVLEQARAKITDARMGVALAQAYIALGQQEKAHEYFQKALRERPEDVAALQAAANYYLRSNQMDDAKKSLEKLIALKGKEPVVAARAEETLAMVMAVSGSYQQSRAALAILQRRKEAQAAATRESELAQALVLANQIGRKFTLEAVALLEKLDQTQPLPGESLFLLVQLYDRLNEPRKFEIALSRLLTAERQNPRYLSYQVSILLRQKKLNEAELWLTQLEKLLPKSLGVVELRARLLHAQKRPAQAVALLEARLPLKEADERTALATANLLDQIDQPAEAEAYYDHYLSLSKQPEAPLVKARFLGRHNQIARALNLVEEAGKRNPPEVVAETCMTILNDGRPGTEEYRRAEEMLNKALAEKSAAVRVLVCLASLAEMRERVEEAERFYRQALERDGRNATALNNLAYLLALRHKDSAEALLLVNRAMELLGPIPELLDTRAVVYHSMGQTDPSIADLEEAITRPGIDAKTLASIAFHLSRSYLALGNRQSAANILQRGQSSVTDVSVINPLERGEYKKLLGELEVRK